MYSVDDGEAETNKFSMMKEYSENPIKIYTDGVIKEEHTEEQMLDRSIK